jgi:predicted metal-binding protein
MALSKIRAMLNRKKNAQEDFFSFFFLEYCFSLLLGLCSTGEKCSTECCFSLFFFPSVGAMLNRTKKIVNRKKMAHRKYNNKYQLDRKGYAQWK